MPGRSRQRRPRNRTDRLASMRHLEGGRETGLYLFLATMALMVSQSSSFACCGLMSPVVAA